MGRTHVGYSSVGGLTALTGCSGTGVSCVAPSQQLGAGRVSADDLPVIPVEKPHPGIINMRLEKGLRRPT